MIEWRRKYRKYKPLTVLRRWCVEGGKERRKARRELLGPFLEFLADPSEFFVRSDVCHMKTVRLAYHTVCQKCSEERGMCGKCGKEAMVHPYQVLGAEPKKDEEQVALAKMTERQRRTYLRELERERSGRRKKSEAIDEPSEDEDDDEFGEMPAPPPNKFDPDMLVKEREARLLANGAKASTPSKATRDASNSDDEEEEDEEDVDAGSDAEQLDGSAESYEDDSDEIEHIDEDAEKLVGKRDAVENEKTAQEDQDDTLDKHSTDKKGENAHEDDDEEDDAGSEDEGDE